MPSSLPQQRIAEERRQREREAAASQTADQAADTSAGILSPEENNRVVNSSIFSRKPTGLAQAKDQLDQTGILGGRVITSPGDNSILGGLEPGQFSQRMTDPFATEPGYHAAVEPAKPPAAATVTTPSQRVIDRGRVRPNPLFDYADYTYGLSLHVIPIEKYNALISTPGYQYKNDDNTILIASAGRRNNTDFRRHPKFKEDFYFENLKFTTVVGLNSRSRNTNAIEMSFTLIEPYGVTLLNRLLSVADEFKTKSWMQIPFLMQIDFFGNSDQGRLLTPIPDQTKYIPVRIIGCKIKVTPKGSEYQVSAIPFSHQALSETSANTPAFLEVQATTVGDFFSATGSAGESTAILDTRRISKERLESSIASARADEDQYGSAGTRSSERIQKAQELNKEAANMTFVVGSYTAALNSFQDQLQRHKHQKKKEIYQFVFTDPEMQNSKIVIPKKTDTRRTPMAKPDTAQGIAAIRSQAGLSTATVNTNKETFTVNAGTSIMEVINMVMRNSDYIRNQFEDPAVEVPAGGQQAADLAQKPINWYKIIPVVQLEDFDDKLDRYAKKITYYIEPYVYYNTKFRDAPKALPTVYAKEYQYIFTGKNHSILNFDIDFDTMFYTAITADRSKVQATAVQKMPTEDQTNDGAEKVQSVRIQQAVTQPVAGQADLVNPASPDSKGVLINDFSKSMMSSSRGDMITVNLKIVGDPELIKQDDVFYNPSNNPRQGTTPLLDPKSNSLVYDAGEVFALLTFKTPVDIDDRTGLMKFENFQTSVFSGLYKILVVENVFERGQFTQSLQLVRLFDQPMYDTVDGQNIGAASSQENRLEDPTTIADSKRPERAIDPYAGYDEATAITMARQSQTAARPEDIVPKATTTTAQSDQRTTVEEQTVVTEATSQTRRADVTRRVAIQQIRKQLQPVPTPTLATPTDII